MLAALQIVWHASGLQAAVDADWASGPWMCQTWNMAVSMTTGALHAPQLLHQSSYAAENLSHGQMVSDDSGLQDFMSQVHSTSIQPKDLTCWQLLRLAIAIALPPTPAHASTTVRPPHLSASMHTVISNQITPSESARQRSWSRCSASMLLTWPAFA